MPNLVVSAVTKYDGKGLAKGKKHISSFDKSVKALGKSLLGLYSISKLAQFGKSSVKAFLADDKAAAALGKTLENTGNSFAKIGVEKFIASLQKQTGVLDDQLRPAFQTLLVATGSVEKAQKGLTTALDVAAGTSADVESVTKAIAKAYAGNTTALGKLVPGIDKAVLASKDLNKINKELARLFGGQASTAAGTYAGQMAILSAAASDAKEIIGKGFIDAFKILANDTTAADLTETMHNLAEATADVTVKIAEMFNKLANDPIIKAILSVWKWSTSLGKKFPTSRDQKAASTPVLDPKQLVADEKTRKAKALADKKALDAAGKLAALTKKGAADALALKKQGSTFDLAQIQIQAALKYNIDRETELRLKLQKALLDENATEATRLNGLLKENEAKTAELALILKTLPKADDPFADWPGIIANINRLMKDLKIPGGATAALATQGLTINAAGTGVVDTGAAELAAAKAAAAEAEKFAADIKKIWADANAKAEADRVKLAAATDAAAAAAEADAAAAAAAEADKAAAEAQAALDAFASAQAAIDAAAQAIFDASFFGAPNMTTGGERAYAQGGGDNYYVTVNAGVVGSEQLLVNEIQNVLQNLNRFGSSTNYAGSIDQ